MLSILIPVYNYYIFDYIFELHKQALLLNCEFEIIVIDDNSSEEYIEENKKISTLKNVNYIELKENIGRSKIRNMLANRANYENIIFSDCDMMPVNNLFLDNYLKNIKKNTVLCGGIKYKTEAEADKNNILRLKYGKKREANEPQKRNLKAHSSFMTGNFCISKEEYKKVQFNEKISTYGHEDTLFGYELKRNNIDVVHINNPLFHCGIDSSQIFIEKTEKAIINLKYIVENLDYTEILEDVKLIKYYISLKKFRKIIKWTFTLAKPLILKNLKSKKPNLLLFDFYKLGFLSSL